MGKQKKKSESSISDNRKAKFNFEIADKYIAGVSLLGWETKSIRENKAQLTEAYVLLKDGEAWLIGCYIIPLKNSNIEMDPTRSRKLLLNKKELAEIFRSTQQKGQTCIPTKLFWKKDNINAPTTPNEAASVAVATPE